MRSQMKSGAQQISARKLRGEDGPHLRWYARQCVGSRGWLRVSCPADRFLGFGGSRFNPRQSEMAAFFVPTPASLPSFSSSKHNVFYLIEANLITRAIIELRRSYTIPRYPSIPHLKRRTILWPTPPFVIESCRRDIGMPEPLLHFGNIRSVLQ